MVKWTVLFMLFIAAGFSVFAQLTESDIKELLIIHGSTENSILEEKTSEIYSSYKSAISYSTSDLFPAISFSIGSGTAEGFFQSRLASYDNIKWLPRFMQDWYSATTSDEAVLARMHTWSKNFREADYILSRNAFGEWNRFFGGRWYIAYPAHWIIKNISSWGIRNKMRYGYFF
ncbi:MAG: hypothetical protein ACM3Q2_17825 [Syntrophothermus sp.]